MVQAWKLTESVLESSTNAHHRKPQNNEEINLKTLENFGIFYQKLDLGTHDTYDENNPALSDYRKNNDYQFADILTVSKECLKNYDETLKCFYNEHFHPDDESRYVLEGAGYFDVRNENDEWIRVRIEKGDLITLPAGMYHRFALDEDQQFLKTVRMFVSEAMWTPIYRPNKDHFIRKEYLKKYNINISDQ